MSTVRFAIFQMNQRLFIALNLPLSVPSSLFHQYFEGFNYKTSPRYINLNLNANYPTNYCQLQKKKIYLLFDIRDLFAPQIDKSHGKILEIMRKVCFGVRFDPSKNCNEHGKIVIESKEK